MGGTPATQVNRGQVVRIDDKMYKVLDRTLNTPGNKRGIITLKLKELGTGSNVSKRLSSDSNVETVWAEKKSCQYLYPEGDGWVFMDNETYEQFTLTRDILGDLMKFVPLNNDVMVSYVDESPYDIELPATVTLEVVEAEPAIRGDTATNVTKKVVCQTGLEVKAPQHIKVGELISVDTRTGDFTGRAKE